MRKIRNIALLTVLFTMLATTVAFGASLRVERTYPKDGAENTTKDNMCVKLYFNEAVGDKASRDVNKDKISIRDEKGKKIPCNIYYDKKNSKYALVLVNAAKVKTVGKNADIKDDMEYKFTLKKGFVSNKGNKLDEDVTVSFKTINQGRNTGVYMAMMVLMFGGMIFFTSHQAKKQRKEAMQSNEQKKEEPFNPYKEAKKTGRSVEEIIAEHEKKEAKKKAKEERERHKAAESDESESGIYKVKKPAPIAAAGSQYKTGRKAEAEKRRAEEAKRKAELKATNYGKNPQKKK